VGPGDLNADGITDLVATNIGSTTASVLLGNGNGSFQPAVNYGAGGRPSCAAIGDYNGDGSQDLAVSNYDSGTVSVLLGAVSAPTVALPVLSPASGTYVTSVTVTISDSTPGATIYYTIDGSTPTTSSTPYTGPFTVTQTTTVKAMAAASGMLNSGVASGTYTIQQQVATPTFSPAGATYLGSVSVTLTDGTPGATIYYTTDGSTPTTASTPYTGPIAVTQTKTVKAMAAASGMADSGVASATYTIQQQVALPVLSPAGGTYISSVTVTISDPRRGRRSTTRPTAARRPPTRPRTRDPSRSSRPARSRRSRRPTTCSRATSPAPPSRSRWRRRRSAWPRERTTRPRP
jgi:hypothetical protein